MNTKNEIMANLMAGYKTTKDFDGISKILMKSYTEAMAEAEKLEKRQEIICAKCSAVFSILEILITFKLNDIIIEEHKSAFNALTAVFTNYLYNEVSLKYNFDFRNKEDK